MVEFAIPVIMHQLAQRSFVQVRKHVGQMGVPRLPGCECRTVDFAKTAHQRVTVLFADLSIFIAVAAV
jgi:hypothetical protein